MLLGRLKPGLESQLCCSHVYSGSAGSGAGVNVDGESGVRTQSKQMCVFSESEQSRMLYPRAPPPEEKECELKGARERNKENEGDGRSKGQVRIK